MNDMRVILDIGNGYIKWVIFGQEDGKPAILAKEMVKTRGMRKGKILDIEDFAVCINEVLEAFSKKLWGDFVEEVFLTVSHPQCYITRLYEQKRILNKQIGHDDVAHLSEVIADSADKPNYEVLKIVPVQWIIDEQTKTKDPIGMEARKLELTADVFMVPKVFYNNILEACDKLDLHVADIIPTILGASEGCLDLDVRDLGVLLVDIGTNQTSYVVYEEGYPLFYGVIPVGWEDVTKDISIGLQVDIKDAEHIKREKGSILLDGMSAGEDASIDKGFLSDIMIARYEQIFEIIQEDLQNHDKEGRLPGGVIIIWGGSKVENILLLAKDVFKIAPFKGKDAILRLWDISHNPQFLWLLGTWTWVEKYHQGKRGWFGISLKFATGLLSRVTDMFKHLF